MKTKKKGNRTFTAYPDVENKTKVDVRFDWGKYWNSESFTIKTNNLDYAIRRADKLTQGM